jgi:hypothetical protein
MAGLPAPEVEIPGVFFQFLVGTRFFSRLGWGGDEEEGSEDGMPVILCEEAVVEDAQGVEYKAKQLGRGAVIDRH